MAHVLDTYLDTRAIRSAVKREFIIIGEAVNILGDLEPDVFARITQARTIVDFRNQLTHGSMTVNDKLVWAFAVRNAPLLRDECAALLAEMNAGQRTNKGNSRQAARVRYSRRGKLRGGVLQLIHHTLARPGDSPPPASP